MLPIRQSRQLEGWLSDVEAVSLYRIARTLPLGSHIVEIGSWKGKSTYCLARGLRQGRVTAIDPFDASGETGSVELYAQMSTDENLSANFRRSMARLGVSEKIEVLEGFSREFVSRIGSISLLFLDGDHSMEGAMFDFANFAPKVIPGGYLALHDYDPARPTLGPTAVVDQLVSQSKEWECIGIFDRLWIGRKRPPLAGGPNLDNLA